MSDVNDIFAACDAARVRIWRDGQAIRFVAKDGIPATLAASLKQYKPQLLTCFPDGYGWERGAIVANPPDLRQTCLSLASERGWPGLLVDAIEDAAFIDAAESAWRVFVRDSDMTFIVGALLELDGVPVARRAVA